MVSYVEKLQIFPKQININIDEQMSAGLSHVRRDRKPLSVIGVVAISYFGM